MTTPTLAEALRQCRDALAAIKAAAGNPEVIYSISKKALADTAALAAADAASQPPEDERPHVGDAQFESWFSRKNMAGIGAKQLCWDAYEAGMNDRASLAQPPAAPAVAGEAADLARDLVAMARDFDIDPHPLFETVLQTYGDARALAAVQKSMPMPEPYAWRSVGGSIWNHKTSPDDEPLYSGDQLRASQALARPPR
jgi:hypothetical protein